jgi:hypothetical protein
MGEVRRLPKKNIKETDYTKFGQHLGTAGARVGSGSNTSFVMNLLKDSINPANDPKKKPKKRKTKKQTKKE